MKDFFNKYDIQLIALIGAISGFLLLVALIVGYQEAQSLFSALDNLSAGF